jgi:hypothetical protein
MKLTDVLEIVYVRAPGVFARGTVANCFHSNYGEHRRC